MGFRPTSRQILEAYRMRGFYYLWSLFLFILSSLLILMPLGVYFEDEDGCYLVGHGAIEAW